MPLKYPPSLDYLLMTLGPTMIALALLENARGPVASAASVYGRVPMFYYLGHIYVIHILALIFAMWQGGDASFLSLDTSSFPEVVWNEPARSLSGVGTRRSDHVCAVQLVRRI